MKKMQIYLSMDFESDKDMVNLLSLLREFLDIHKDETKHISSYDWQFMTPFQEESPWKI